VPVIPHTVGYLLINACTVMVSSTSPVSVGPALQLSDAAARGVDQVHGVVPHDVVHVPVQQHVRVQRHVDLGQGGADVLLGVEVDSAEPRLDLLRPRFGEVHVAAVLVRVEVLARGQLADHPDDLDPRGLPVRGAGQHQRHQRLVHEHRVGLVDQRHVGAR
jgi:hypothetical protein